MYLNLIFFVFIFAHALLFYFIDFIFSYILFRSLMLPKNKIVYIFYRFRSNSFKYNVFIVFTLQQLLSPLLDYFTSTEIILFRVSSDLQMLMSYLCCYLYRQKLFFINLLTVVYYYFFLFLLAIIFRISH